MDANILLLPVRIEPPAQLSNGQWMCVLCTFLNLASRQQCEMCTTPRVQDGQDPDALAAAAAVTAQESEEAERAAAEEEKWTCGRCGANRNAVSSEMCGMCGTKRESHRQERGRRGEGGFRFGLSREDDSDDDGERHGEDGEDAMREEQEAIQRAEERHRKAREEEDHKRKEEEGKRQKEIEEKTRLLFRYNEDGENTPVALSDALITALTCIFHQYAASSSQVEDEDGDGENKEEDGEHQQETKEADGDLGSRNTNAVMRESDLVCYFTRCRHSLNDTGLHRGRDTHVSLSEFLDFYQRQLLPKTESDSSKLDSKGGTATSTSDAEKAAAATATATAAATTGTDVAVATDKAADADAEKTADKTIADTAPFCLEALPGGNSGYKVSNATEEINGEYKPFTVPGYCGASTYNKPGTTVVLLRWKQRCWIFMEMGPNFDQYPSRGAIVHYKVRVCVCACTNTITNTTTTKQ